MTMEILLALWNKVNHMCAVGAGAALVLAAVFGFMSAVESDVSGLKSEEVCNALRRLRRSLVAAVIFGAVAVLPTTDDLWAARIGLIKLELSSPENLSAGRDRLDEIVRGLECKHLGTNCPKEPKP